MFTRLILLSNIYLYQYVLCDNNIKIDFIKDYITEQDEPTGVNIFSCWSLDSSVKLLNIIFKNNVQATDTNINKLDLDIKHFNRGVFILDLSCNHSMEILKLANKKYLFKRPYHWLLLANDNSQNKAASILLELDAFLDSQIIYSVNVHVHRYVSSYIYKIGKDSGCIMHELATWEYQTGFVFYDNGIFTRKRTNLHGYALTSASVFLNNHSFKLLYTYRQNDVDIVAKITYVLTTYIMDYMNATHNALFASSWEPYNETADENENKTMLGMIRNNVIDISGSPLMCLKKRLQYLHCIVPATRIKIPFIFRQPPLSYVKNIYILPFDSMLWITDISFLIFSSIFLFIIVLWEWKINNENNIEPPIDMIDSTFSDAVLFTIGVVSQQGYATEPKGVPGKILMITLFLTLIFLFTAYSAYTVVLFQSTADDIKTVEDLYYSQIELGVDNKPYMKSIFEVYTEGIKAKLYREKIAPPGEVIKLYSLRDGIEKMRTEYFAFNVGHIYSYKIIEDTFLNQEKCGLEEINIFPDLVAWMAAPKKSAFLEIFKIGYLKIAEAGLNARENRKRISKKPECLSQGNNYRSVGIIDLYPVYMLLIIGLATSGIILIVERASRINFTCRKTV